MKYAAAQDRDGNFQVINGLQPFKLESTWTFVAGTTGAVGSHTLFTVTGNVLASVFGICSTSITGAGTIEVGTTDSTAGLIAQMADAESLDARKSWVDATPSYVESFTTTQDRMSPIAGKDIILTIGTADLTAGVVDFYCLFRPLSSDGNVEVTTPA